MEIVTTAARNAFGKTRAPAVAAAACLLAVLAILAWPGSADSRPATVLLMGKTSETPPPACPRNCTAEGRLTGFQSLASDGTTRPFQAPYDGKLISWSISLGNPGSSDRAFFTELLDRPPQARIAVIKRVGTRPITYKLVRQSPTQMLTPYFGQTVQFALDHPLTVLEDQVVALTVPTWAPMFADNLPLGNTWRGSREDGHCEYPDPSVVGVEKTRAYAQENHPQQKVGSEKEYSCYFEGSRLLYSAMLVKKPRRG